MNSNVSIFRRYERAQWNLALLTLPTAGVVEYDATPILQRISAENLTGPARRQALRNKLENL